MRYEFGGWLKCLAGGLFLNLINYTFLIGVGAGLWVGCDVGMLARLLSCVSFVVDRVALSFVWRGCGFVLPGVGVVSWLVLGGFCVLPVWGGVACRWLGFCLGLGVCVCWSWRCGIVL